MDVRSARFRRQQSLFTIFLRNTSSENSRIGFKKEGERRRKKEKKRERVSVVLCAVCCVTSTQANKQLPRPGDTAKRPLANTVKKPCEVKQKAFSYSAHPAPNAVASAANAKRTPRAYLTSLPPLQPTPPPQNAPTHL